MDVHLIKLEVAQNVIAVGMGIHHHQRLIGQTLAERLGIAHAKAGVDQHRLLCALYQVAQRGASAGREQRPNAVRQLFHFHKRIFFVSHVRSPF